ncbi:hypothetical protein GCM10011321_31860 [Youhaiella tibetensis]|uniref:Uncharacterized protein n=1 Tax=Paradevosia tibetensis TaxID=1447062 RepID=A0A5B9DJ51_9HYPH|nr:hypothetical protein [Youhaiella tibetensis]QEE18855.1 hypothetical protein FNA67_01080 [Youhaiella tibetensis]GGF38537.1 hypothetical protein GCM10011321_31860 [Youhaiella tibetensis]
MKPAPAGEHVSAERIERCLDRLAVIVHRAGKSGHVYLPYAEYLEAALAEARARELSKDAIRERLMSRLKNGAAE